MKKETVARLLIHCEADRPGIVAAVSNFFYNHGANITALDQHSTDPVGGSFFLRLEFQTPNLDVGRQMLEDAFQQAVASRYDMDWKISYSADTKKTAIFVSKYDHALLELLWRWKRGELDTDICMVISNHPDLKEAVEQFGIPYHHIAVTKENKTEAEAQVIDMLKGKVDLIILARYMQILSADFCQQFPNQIINIHHSFLPAFAGANPYRKAYEKGVKLIGATAHYVTADLDEGPIIEQDTVRVNHRYNAAELMELGRDVERNVLARAVKWHLEDRIIVDKNKTIVFAN